MGSPVFDMVIYGQRNAFNCILKVRLRYCAIVEVNGRTGTAFLQTPITYLKQNRKISKTIRRVMLYFKICDPPPILLTNKVKHSGETSIKTITLK